MGEINFDDEVNTWRPEGMIWTTKYWAVTQEANFCVIWHREPWDPNGRDNQYSPYEIVIGPYKAVERCVLLKHSHKSN